MCDVIMAVQTSTFSKLRIHLNMEFASTDCCAHTLGVHLLGESNGREVTRSKTKNKVVATPDDRCSHLSMICGSTALACLLFATASNSGASWMSQHLPDQKEAKRQTQRKVFLLSIQYNQSLRLLIGVFPKLYYLPRRAYSRCKSTCFASSCRLHHPGVRVVRTRETELRETFATKPQKYSKNALSKEGSKPERF